MGIGVVVSEQATTPPLGQLHAPLTDQVTDQIRAEIIEGSLPPASRLVERDLAARLAVSRVPVREALQRLETEGFVTRLPRRGVVVSTVTEQDLRNIFDVREGLEVQAVRLAAQRATAQQVEHMQQALARARRALSAGDIPTFNAMNEAFHDLVTAAAQNPVLTAVLEPLQGRLHWLLRQNDEPDLMRREHEAMLAAIKKRDVERAATLAAKHVQTSRTLATEVLFRSKAVRVDAG